MSMDGDIFSVLALLKERRYSQALIRLWLLAERRGARGQALSRWWLACDQARHESMVASLLAAFEADRPRLPAKADEQPLALIVAVDQWLGDQADLPMAPAALPRLETGDATYWLVRRRGPRNTPADRQEPNLEKWFRNFRVIPDSIRIGAAEIVVRIVPVPDRGNGLHGKDRVVVRVSHFDDGAKVDVVEAEDRFHVRSLIDGGLRKEALLAEVNLLRDSSVHLWVAPELTVPPSLRSDVKQALAAVPPKHLLLCVPGSFHEDRGRGLVNCAEVVDGDGAVVARHEKLSAFSYETAGRNRAEAIAVGGVITLLATPIGLIGVAICKDYCDETASGLIDSAWNRLAPDWMLVPSMGDEKTVQAHQARAEEHWKLRRICSVVANQQAASTTPWPGFVHGRDTAEVVKVGGSTLDVDIAFSKKT